ncbi:amino acid ABC transporter ATP-binding protein [Candidatus Methylacidithermus pantelleriae]|uniref:Cystine ABC transporter ATP binding subunit n=1 Tax=Candidatus Methylacidithermus pantelleriae TaxID=2744239 RepID=A0A8J2FV09_9BACT|nr:amino acid ABC transporter ATP-binding protein [Candidatus Methylacidithermus pantelleriae]CAF0689595.1 cystine ABC transporter ATP binding subunit [Candidatus Methylacidithermus pantelleriae]
MRLELVGITKSYRGTPVLRNIEAHLSGVQCVAILGPSGSGKSTLLRILAGLEVPEEGTVLWEGQPLPNEPARLLQWRRSVGVVFQSFNLFPHLTALQNLVLPLEKAHGYSKSQAKERAWAALAQLRLAEHAHKKPAQLSGGMRQRVAIARALVIEPQILFLDEPTSALDPESAQEVLKLVKEIAEQKRNLVLVTHHVGFARSIADWGIFLAHETILEQGPASQFFVSPQTEELKRFLEKLLF